MKRDKLFQSFLLISGIIVLIGTPAKGEEVRENGIVQPSTQTVGKVLENNFVVKDVQSKSPVSVSSSGKPGQFQSQIANSFSRVKSDKPSKNIPQLSEIELPATSAAMLVQARATPTNSPNPAPRNVSPEQRGQHRGTVLITGVKANPTDKGLEVILETTQKDQLQVVNRSTGNNFIADITGGQLRLPSPDAFTFRSEKPLAGIIEITVTNVDANTVRVTVVGEKALPVVELFDDNVGLVFGVGRSATMTQPETPQTTKKPATQTQQDKPAAQQDNPIELVVTGKQDGYRVPDANTGTRLDIPLLETPASIGVITRELIDDTTPKRGEDLIPFIPGVSRGSEADDNQGGNVPEFTIRGFSVARQIYINGLRDSRRFVIRDLANVDRIEILKGLSSLLYGTGAPGGVVNYITKKPQATSSNNITFQAGSFNSYRGEVDFTGPLNTEKTLLYRFVGAAQDADSFYDNVEDNRLLIASTLTWLTGNGGSVTLEADYFQQELNFNSGIKFFKNKFLYDRSYVDPRDRSQRDNYRVSTYIDQPLTKNWSINLSGQYIDINRDLDIFSAAVFNQDRLRFITRPLTESYTQGDLKAELRGNFKIGASEHKQLVGFEYNTFKADTILNISNLIVGSIDPLNPVFNEPLPNFNLGNQFYSNKQYGIYIQDFMKLGQFRVLAGLRYGSFKSKFKPANPTIVETNAQTTFISPTVGLVYNFTDSASVYASFSRSTEPNDGRRADGSLLEPKTATQYEIGTKVNLLNNQLSITGALFDLTQTNIAEPDPNNPDFSILVGEVRSRGLELQAAGKVTDNLSLIAAYTLLDTKINKNSEGLHGNTFINSPSNSLGIYAKYNFTKGALRGLSLSSGLIYVSERQGDSANSFEVPSYVRVDLGAAYTVNHLIFRLGIENLFDTRYVVSVGNAANVLQGSPLAVTGSVSIKF
ncbi:TonB-dependent siderophore receptor [Brasilonema octagenarum]|uniref:TonB-dependent siderophore receptor n=1 Tax=Brasilonema octagenarum UFV-OR1 TaxID=417115 RepID=A0ABX1MA20_9CYAN|nr:TonB-dependent siderophore receptor [Brasilonema octagenarum]NMF63809.1 TonB-dependent siderophore receptor [Brasilonema octagenarum UFV-OR1]